MIFRQSSHETLWPKSSASIRLTLSSARSNSFNVGFNCNRSSKSNWRVAALTTFSAMKSFRQIKYTSNGSNRANNSHRFCQPGGSCHANISDFLLSHVGGRFASFATSFAANSTSAQFSSGSIAITSQSAVVREALSNPPSIPAVPPTTKILIRSAKSPRPSFAPVFRKASVTCQASIVMYTQDIQTIPEQSSDFLSKIGQKDELACRNSSNQA